MLQWNFDTFDFVSVFSVFVRILILRFVFAGNLKRKLDNLKPVLEFLKQKERTIGVLQTVPGTRGGEMGGSGWVGLGHR